MKKILAPVDFSNESAHAAYYAAGLAREINVKLTLLYVFNLPMPVSEAPFPVDFSRLEEENKQMLNDLAGEIKERSGIMPECRVVCGMPVEEILEMTSGNYFGLVVMGSRGAGGTLSTWMGSTATAVIRHSLLPILVVPAGFDFTPWKQILLAFDFRAIHHAEVFDDLKQWSRLFVADITVLNIVEEGAVEEKAKELAGSETSHFLDGLKYQFHFEKNHQVRAGLDNYLKGHPADLIVIVPHTHNWLDRLFFQTHSENLMLHTQRPILALPDIE
ncbi:MAG: universal stress protein [Bacteroidia bacterium]